MSPLFPSYWIGFMKRTNQDNLDCTATLSSVPDGATAGDVDDSGNVSQTPTVVASNIPCRINRWGTLPTEAVVADQLSTNSRWVVTFGVGERRVKSGHLLDVTGSTSGVPWVRSLKVIEPLDPVSDEVMTQVLCDEA